jgi:hypothetical protein
MGQTSQWAIEEKFFADLKPIKARVNRNTTGKLCIILLFDI